MLGRRNSGIFKQDAVIGQFSKDARSTIINTTVNDAIRQGKVRAEYVAKQPEKIRVSFKFLATGK
jgi:hypothetical protein|tara:strand:+ start:145 stop:339 length:195 start_codon:yes stop_codon:yes gene_type:complete